MSRTTSTRRKPAPSPKSVQARQHELNTKRRGELAELAFTLKAASLGFGVSKPYGDSERYDVIIDPRNLLPGYKATPSHPERSRSSGAAKDLHLMKPVAQAQSAPDACPISSGPSARETEKPSLHRIQIKCSTQLFEGLYRVNAHRRTNGRAVPYHPSEIDFIAAYIIPEDTWYIIPIQAVRGTSLLFRRKRDRKPGLYDEYKEAWHLLRHG
jgi:hypothetical protein